MMEEAPARLKPRRGGLMQQTSRTRSHIAVVLLLVHFLLPFYPTARRFFNCIHIDLLGILLQCQDLLFSHHNLEYGGNIIAGGNAVNIPEILQKIKFTNQISQIILGLLAVVLILLIIVIINQIRIKKVLRKLEKNFPVNEQATSKDADH